VGLAWPQCIEPLELGVRPVMVYITPDYPEDGACRTLRKPLNFLNFDIDSLQTSTNMVVVASRKARRNDALDMFEAVSAYIYSANGLKPPALTNIEIRYSGKIIARRNGQANHYG
jgi:hypothetical protein